MAEDRDGWRRLRSALCVSRGGSTRKQVYLTLNLLFQLTITGTGGITSVLAFVYDWQGILSTPG